MYHRVYMTWKIPNVDNVSVTNYSVRRAAGARIASLSAGVPIGSPSALTFVDTEELPDGKPFVYWVQANFLDNSVSGVNNFVVIKGVDDAPVANGDSYNFVTSGSTMSLIVGGPGVLGNDTDDDTSPSPQTGAAGKLRVTSNTNPANGTLTVNADGSFTYTPFSGFKGTDTFTYTADDGKWPRDTSVSLNSYLVECCHGVDRGLIARGGRAESATGLRHSDIERDHRRQDDDRCRLQWLHRSER